MKHQKAIRPQIISMLRGYGVSKNRITPHARLSEDLGLDSLQVINLLMDIEMRFQISISDEDADHLVNMKAMVQYVQSIAENNP